MPGQGYIVLDQKWLFGHEFGHSGSMWPVRGGRSIVLPPPWHTAAPAFLRSTIAFIDSFHRAYLPNSFLPISPLRRLTCLQSLTYSPPKSCAHSLPSLLLQRGLSFIHRHHGSLLHSPSCFLCGWVCDRRALTFQQTHCPSHLRLDPQVGGCL